MGPSKDIGPRKQSKQSPKRHSQAPEDKKVRRDGPSDGPTRHQSDTASALKQSKPFQDAMRRAEIKAQDRLRTRRLQHASVTLASESEPSDDKTNYLYFVNDADIKDIVKMIMDTLPKSMTFQSIPKQKSQDRVMSQGCPILPAVDRERNSITPGLSTAAEPATTISVPKTFFAHTNWGMRQLSADYPKDDGPTRTTILSRGSVSEILWGENFSSEPARVSRSQSSARLFDSSTNHKRILRQSTFKSGLGQDIMILEPTVARYLSSPLEQLPTNLPFHKRMSRSTDEDSNITSFPELRPRQCTNDWLNPPVEIEQLVRVPTSDLYHRGVDAHSGMAPTSPTGTWAAPLSIAVPCDHSIFDKDPFYYSSIDSHERRVTNRSSSTGKRRLGSSIGSSSHRRRSSHIPLSYDSPWDSQDSLFPRFVDKLRQSSQYDFSQQGHQRPD